MIIDRLENASFYLGLSQRMDTALRYLRNADFSKIGPGRYDLEGGNLYALVQQYETKPMKKGCWEAHRRYLDVQYVVSGVELIGYAHVSDLKAGLYDDKTDFLPLEGNGNFLKVEAGFFMILMPQDAHMPAIAVADPRPVKKIVVKVLTAEK